MRSQLSRSILAALLLAFLAGMAAETALAQKRGKKPPTPKLPDLKTPQDKLLFLEIIRRSVQKGSVGSRVNYTPDTLDESLEKAIDLPESKFTPLIDDETFIRRVSLDLTGRPPKAREIERFVEDPNRRKRKLLIDRLLETDAYARKWARYWRSVIFHNSMANKKRVNPQALEDWLTLAFQQNAPWDRIVAEMVSATPKRSRSDKKDYGQNHGPNNFVLACRNKPTEIAAQTARIFMGISVQCAECHDHPFDQWKREQFHEMAAFFAPGNYYMTDAADPTQKTKMQARFLLGEKPPEYLKPDQRRVAVAAYLIYNGDNYWFARAYVNRIWNELLGDGFYSVDSLGPDAEVMHKLVINRLSALFRFRGFDPKWLFRVILNSKTYQREIRTPDSDEELFTAVRPTRLRPDQVAASVENLIGTDENIERDLNRVFRADPSIPQRDLEGSIQQALLMMNGEALQQRLRNSPLKQRLVAVDSQSDLVRELYLGVLARTPTEREMERSRRYLDRVTNQAEAVDDLIWVLVNSTEFVTKR